MIVFTLPSGKRLELSPQAVEAIRAILPTYKAKTASAEDKFAAEMALAADVISAIQQLKALEG